MTTRITYDPPLPPLRDQFCQHAPQGSLMKFEAIYSRPWWRDKGLNGQSVSETGPIAATFDSSPKDGNPGILLGFIGGHQARTWMQRSPDDLRTAALNQLAGIFGDEARSPVKTLVMNWTTEEWSRGCPVMVLGPGTLTEFGSWLRAPVGRVHWAGTETSDYWAGYMDGAVRSGERAAGEVAPLLGATPGPAAAPAPKPKPKSAPVKRKHARHKKKKRHTTAKHHRAKHHAG
jgi:monoamine oxidase